MQSRLLAVLLVAGAVVAGCNRKSGAPGAGGPGGFAVQVVAAAAKTEPVIETVSLVGNILPNEFIDLNAETDGIIKEIRFNEGQEVKKGDVLVLLDDTKLAPQVAEAEAQLELARTLFERNRKLYEDRLLSKQEFDTASASFKGNEAAVDLKRRQLRDARIVAPFSGVIGARDISPGQVITKASRLTQLVDLDTVKVQVDVPERYLNQLKEGQQVEFRVAAFPKDTFKGEVYFISPQLDPGTRTAQVRARIPNDDHKLRGGMFANLELTLQLRDSALVIPEPAILNNGDMTLVFAVTSTNTVYPKPVTTGLRLAGKVEILKGLVAGERVVVEGVQKLRPGAPVSFNTNAADAYTH